MTDKRDLETGRPKQTNSPAGDGYLWRTNIDGAIPAGFTCEFCGRGSHRLAVYTVTEPDTNQPEWWATHPFYCSRRCWEEANAVTMSFTLTVDVAGQHPGDVAERIRRLLEANTDMAVRVLQVQGE